MASTKNISQHDLSRELHNLHDELEAYNDVLNDSELRLSQTPVELSIFQSNLHIQEKKFMNKKWNSYLMINFFIVVQKKQIPKQSKSLEMTRQGRLKAKILMEKEEIKLRERRRDFWKGLTIKIINRKKLIFFYIRIHDFFFHLYVFAQKRL